MKYANINWENNVISGSDMAQVNFGDICQFMAIDHLYDYMGISQNEIVRISLDEVKTYQGECLILPFNWNVMDIAYMEGNILSISNDIIPVYLAVHIGSPRCKEEYFNEYNISYLKRFEPIGCRDEITCLYLREIGLDAYTNGCMTSTFDKRINSGTKVLLIDVPVDLIDCIPSDLLKNAKAFSQQMYIHTSEADDAFKNVKKRYEYYKENASLVITSRLHAAAPCMAMGIPVIFAKEKIDTRFSWLEKLLPLYGKDEWDIINWRPEPVEYEDLKELMLKNAANRLMETYSKYSIMREINDFFAERNKKEYCSYLSTVACDTDSTISCLSDMFSSSEQFSYSVWGCNEAADNLVDLIKLKYPNAVLVDCIDKFKNGTCCGKEIITPDRYQWKDNEVLFVLAVGASGDAHVLQEKLEIPFNNVIYVGQQYITEKMLVKA